MANYALTDYTTNEEGRALRDVMADLETYIETIDDSKTIRFIDIKKVGGGFVGCVLHDA